jgi:hypothetical protein
LITIFHLVTVRSKILVHLFIVKITFVQDFHFIHDTTSDNHEFFFTSFQSTFKIISHHFNQAFSAGDQDIGEITLKTHASSISTYAQIHSYSQLRLSLKFLFSTGGK